MQSRLITSGEEEGSELAWGGRQAHSTGRAVIRLLRGETILRDFSRGHKEDLQYRGIGCGGLQIFIDLVQMTGLAHVHSTKRKEDICRNHNRGNKDRRTTAKDPTSHHAY